MWLGSPRDRVLFALRAILFCDISVTMLRELKGSHEPGTLRCCGFTKGWRGTAATYPGFGKSYLTWAKAWYQCRVDDGRKIQG
jgi:hypothetical protein